MNDQHPNIHFTSDSEVDGKFSFLDVNIDSNSGNFVTSVYKKPTFSGVYGNYDSFIPHGYKIGLVPTLLHRAFCICSSWSLFHIEVEKLRLILHRNFIDKCIERFLNSVFKPRTVTIELLYLGKLSFRCSCAFIETV